jgi:leucyl-tRNA synthetase
MAVPAHDSRDHEFALAFGLPMRLVVSPREGQDWDQKKAYAGDGLLVNSSYEIDLNGLSTVEAGMKVTTWLEKIGLGKKQVRRRILSVSHDVEALKGTADDHKLVCSNGCFM